MQFKGIFIVIKRLHVHGITIFPFVFVRNKNLVNDQVFKNHEQIHLAQQIELLIFPFYLLYLMHYLINLLRYRNHQMAYKQIIFEREAYKEEGNVNYLGSRKWMAWIYS